MVKKRTTRDVKNKRKKRIRAELTLLGMLTDPGDGDYRGAAKILTGILFEENDHNLQRSRMGHGAPPSKS